MRVPWPRLTSGLMALLAAACGGDASSSSAGAPVPVAADVPRHVLLVTIDTLRADRVGAYGYAAARTPHLDALAEAGLRATRAYATSPVTLPSHASLLTGRYPPAHGARHNGVALPAGVPTLATRLKAAGFATAAFVSAFPLDRRFGLAAGFDVYGDRLARGADGRPADERAGQLTVDDALAWRRSTGEARTFLWVHLFEPHAPYGDVGAARPVHDRYDDEVSEADRQVGRLLDGLGDARASTLVVVTADHGEAFGEHGETGHSVFVYDTTLQVPLITQGPGSARGLIGHAVSLVDVAPTILAATQVPPGDMAMDGQPLRQDAGLVGGDTPPRPLYAETMAPFEDFGWSPLRAVRAGSLKYILAPTPELYDLAADPAESVNLATARQADAARLKAAIAPFAGAPPSPSAALTAETRRRLQALGYLGGTGPTAGRALVDPKDRKALAARIAEVTSGELSGAALEAALTGILADDPGNPQAALRLGYLRVARDDCRGALPHFQAAIRSGMPTADAHLGLAGCLAAARRTGEALQALDEAARVEPDNPVVLANAGTLRSDAGRPAEGVPYLRRALDLDPDLHQARFALAIALARLGDRAAAEAEARALLGRMPASAPQRAEVERLLDAVR